MADKERKQGDDSAIFNALTIGEATELIAATENDRDHLLFRILWTTGARISEVLELRPIDILSVDSLRVVNEKQYKYPKGYNGPRRIDHKTCYVPDDIIIEMQRYCLAENIHGGSFVFAGRGKFGHLTRQAAWKIMRRLARRVDISKSRGDKTITPAWLHLFRHGWAVNGLRQGMNLRAIGDQLGHASSESTRVYARVADEDRRIAVKRLNFGLVD